MSLWFVLQQEQAAFELSEELFQRIDDGDYDEAVRAIDAGADVNRFHGLLPPLHFACFAGRHSIASALLAAGAQVNTRDGYDCTPLHYAAQARDPECVKLLLRSRASVDEPAQGGRTALHLACASADSASAEAERKACRTVRLLLQGGADSNALTVYHDTPLHFAATSASLVAMRLLLNFGAQVDVRNSVSFSPLLVCAVRFCELRENEASDAALVRVRDCLKLLILASGQPSLAGLNNEALSSRRVATLLERLCCNARPLFALARHSVRRAILDQQVYLPCAIETLTLPRRIKEHILFTYLK